MPTAKKKRPARKTAAKRKAPTRRVANPFPSPGRKAMLKKAAKVPGARKMTAARRMEFVRAEDLLDEAERAGAVRVEYQPSSYPDTSWMDARALKSYHEGRDAFYDTVLIDESGNRDVVIDSLGESHVRDNASGEAYLKSVALEMVMNHRPAIIAAIKRARKNDR